MQAFLPRIEIVFSRVSCGGVARESGGHDHSRPCPEENQAGFVADFYAAPSHESHFACQVGGLAAFAHVKLRTGRAHSVIEVVKFGELHLANITRNALGKELLRYVLGGR